MKEIAVVITYWHIKMTFIKVNVCIYGTYISLKPEFVYIKFPTL